MKCLNEKLDKGLLINLRIRTIGRIKPRGSKEASRTWRVLNTIRTHAINTKLHGGLREKIYEVFE
jgi:hypothetical protein